MTIISKPTKKEVSERKLETYSRYNEIIQWGRAYPVEFCSRFLGVELLDNQKYIIYGSWFCEFALWLMARNGGKTTLLAIYTMLRSLLIPFHNTYFLGNTGEQAKEVFKKIEQIAKHEIESFAGSTDVFREEVRLNGSNGDGFVHNPASFSCVLFNNSAIYTLNSDVIRIKGRRANLVCFDEAGWFSDELFLQAEQFVNQSENFKLGGDIDLTVEPLSFPRQLLYASSASDRSSEFYKKFKKFTEQMLIGNTHYFTCNFTIETVMKSKFNGEYYPPLISQEKVDKALSENREKALRELYNKFSADSHEGQILTRRDLAQHTANYIPVLYNEGNKTFVFAWDSARLNDNSVISIAEFINDPEIGWRMEIANVVSLVDIATKKKIPKRLPEQVDEFKDLLLRYNGVKKADYENIKAIVCDSGAGGQMVGGIADYLMDDWRGSDGRVHKGIIDRTHKSTETARSKYPDAVDILRLVDPQKARNAIFDAAEKCVKLGIVKFPAEYSGKDFIYFIDDDGNEIRQDLIPEEQISLAQIELMKTEIVTMCKYENVGNIKYDYPPDKRRTTHDDRVFSFGLLCYYLMQLRHGETYTKKRNNDKLDLTLLVRKPSILPQRR